MNGKPEVQKLSYFTEGNDYAGSCSRDGEPELLIRYYVKPERETGLLRAFCWREDLAFDLAGDRKEREFSLSEEGLEELIAWLQEEFDSL